MKQQGNKRVKIHQFLIQFHGTSTNYPSRTSISLIIMKKGKFIELYKVYILRILFTYSIHTYTVYLCFIRLVSVDGFTSLNFPFLDKQKVFLVIWLISFQKFVSLCNGLNFKQYCGSVTLWYGSGCRSGSSDPYL